MIFSQENIIKALENGEVVGIPTDTVYGFATLPENAYKIYDLKKRDPAKKLITFIKDVKLLNEVDNFTKEEVEILTKDYWPGNNTLIFKQNNVFNAYRIPKEENVINLLKMLGENLVTTSANISGARPCLTKEQFVKTFPEIKLLEELVVKHKTNVPSNIYVVDEDGTRKIR